MVSGLPAVKRNSGIQSSTSASRRLCFSASRLVQHLRQRLVLLERDEQHLTGDAASQFIPAGELGGGGGLAAAGIGVQNNDALGVESAVEREQGFVASEETGVRPLFQFG